MADLNENRPGYKKTKVGWIPEEWEFANIGMVSALKSGQHLSQNEYWKETQDDNDVPYFTGPTDIVEELPKCEKWTSMNGKVSEKGELLITVKGSGAGRIDIMNLEVAVIGRQLMSLNSIKAENLFIFYWIKNRQERLAVLSYGNMIPGLSRNDILSFPIPLPPLPEQTRIATILSTWDEAIQKLDRLIERKRMLKKGLMQQLLTGRLRFPEFVPEGGTKYKETKLGMVPEEWECITFEKVFSFLSTTSFSRKDLTGDKTEREVFYIHYGDIHTIYKQPYIEIPAFSGVPKLKDEVKFPKNLSWLKDGDLVIADASEDYEGVGECKEVRITGSFHVISGLHTFAVRDISGKTIKGFRTYILKNPSVRNALRRIATGSKVYGISKTNLSKFKIILPTKVEQHRITEILSELEEEIVRLEKEKEKLAEQKKGLMQQLLTGAVRVNS